MCSAADDPTMHDVTPDRADLRDRLDNDIREVRGAEPAEIAQRLLDRGWTLATPEGCWCGHDMGWHLTGDHPWQGQRR